jgi:hypothetical protein
MTSHDSPLPLVDLPPSEPHALHAWLAEREEELGDLLAEGLGLLMADWGSSVLGLSLTAALDPASFDKYNVAWNAFVRGIVTEFLGGMYLAGGVSAFLASAADKMSPDAASLWSDVVNRNAVEYQLDAANKIVGMTDVAFGDVQKIVSDAVASGANIPELTKQLDAATNMGKTRSKTVARTEVVGAFNNGDFNGAIALGEFGPVEKVWLATLDGRTRDSHAEVDMQVRLFSEPFDVGGDRMDYPHAPGGSAAEVVNCRCTTMMLYAGDRRPDGTVVGEDADPARAAAVS